MDSLVKILAKDLIIVPVIVTVYIFFLLKGQRRKEFLILVIAGGILSLILSRLGSHLYTDPRPFYKEGVKPLFHGSSYNGFPSDHTLLSSFLGFAALYYSRKVGIVLLAIAAVIGWARVYAGVHHLTDILGSFIITAISFLIVRYLVHEYSLRRKPQKES